MRAIIIDGPARGKEINLISEAQGRVPLTFAVAEADPPSIMEEDPVLKVPHVREVKYWPVMWSSGGRLVLYTCKESAERLEESILEWAAWRLASELCKGCGDPRNCHYFGPKGELFNPPCRAGSIWKALKKVVHPF